MKKIIFYIVMIGILAVNVQFVAAQQTDTYTLLEPLPSIQGVAQDPGCTSGNVLTCISMKTFVEYVFKFAIALAVFLATVMIIFGGFQWMLSEVPFTKIEGKSRITRAILGLLAALISYLLLLTIDPRLVQINTTIPQLVVDTSSVDEFQRGFQQDLRRFTQQSRTQVLQLENARIGLERQLADNERALASGEIDEYAAADRAAELRRQLADIDAQQRQAIGTGIGSNHYEQAITQIYDPRGSTSAAVLSQYTANTVPNTLSNGRYPTDSPNRIQNDYNRQINDLLAVSPQTEATTQSIRTLERQRDFYIAQVREDVTIGHNVRELNSTFNVGAAAEIQTLSAMRTQYQARLAALAGDSEPARAAVVDSGLSIEQYRQMLQARIEIISQTIDQNR